MSSHTVKRESFGKCPTCGRMHRLTFHHLIPRKMHRRTHFKKHYSKDELAAGVNLCRQCHSVLHKTYNEMELAKHFSSLDAILQNEHLAHQFRWIGKQRVKIKG